MPVPVNDVITQLTLLIDSKEYELVRGKLRYDQAIRERLHKMSNELKGLAATGQATDKQVKAIIDREYFRAYVDERTKTGSGKTNKETPLLDIFENKDTGIVAHAFDVLVAKGQAKAADNFLIPPGYNGSKLESAIAETVTTTQTLREVLFQALTAIHAAARVSPPDEQPKSASKDAKAKYKTDHAEWKKNNEETYDALIQKFANAMKIVARLSKQGKEIWNGIIESELNNHSQARMMNVDLSAFKFTNDKDFSEGKLKDTLAPKILYGDHGNGPRMRIAETYLADNAAILTPTPVGSIPVRTDFVTYLKLLIDQQATQLDGKNLSHSKETIKALEGISAELAALPSTASQSDVKDIMDKAYASAYITDRTLGGVLIEGTVKGPMIKLLEGTIFPEAMDVQKAIVTASENFLNPPKSKDDQSFEARLFQTISDSTVTEIFAATLRAYLKASPPSNKGSDPALQQFANGVKAAARLSEAGRVKWNELVQQVGEGVSELQITKSGLKKDLYSESNIKKSIFPEMKTKQTDAAVSKFLSSPSLDVRPSISVTPSVAQPSVSRPSASVSAAPPPAPPRPAGRVSPPPVPPRGSATQVPPPPSDIPPPPPLEGTSSRRGSESKGVPSAPPAPPAPPMNAGRKSSAAAPDAPPMAPPIAPPMSPSRKNSGAAPDAPPAPPAPPRAPSPSHTGMFKPAAGGRGALLDDIAKGRQLKKAGEAKPVTENKENSRSGLLDEIKGGAKLRKVDVSQSKRGSDINPSGSTTPVSQGAISSNLASRVEEEMKKRNQALSGSDNDSDNDSDSDWDDDDSYSSPKPGKK